MRLFSCFNYLNGLNCGVGMRRLLLATSVLTMLTVTFLGCSQLAEVKWSEISFHTSTYKAKHDSWTREANIHQGLEASLIISATYKSAEFRQAYIDEYAATYQLTPAQRSLLLIDEEKAVLQSHDFVVAAYVVNKKWDDFDKIKSSWRFYLENDQHERVEPIEIKKLLRNDPIMDHFFPQITPWKTTYYVRFPINVAGSGKPVMGTDTANIKMVIAGVVGTVEMTWQVLQHKEANSSTAAVSTETLLGN